MPGSRLTSLLLRAGCASRIMRDNSAISSKLQSRSMSSQHSGFRSFSASPKIGIMAGAGVVGGMAGLYFGALSSNSVASASASAPDSSLDIASGSNLWRFHLWYAVPLRLARDAYTAAAIVLDYKYSLLGLPEGSLEWEKAKHEAHVRCANRLRKLCFDNGGIYIKLGQHLGQLEYLIPTEYVEIMRRSMLDKCPVSSYEQVCDVFMKDFGRLPQELFAEFDPIPLASASLAQVHAARTFEGKKVAVKVQHTHLTDTATVDTATVELVVNVLHRLFPAFDYRWLVEEIRESLPKELDFLHEARNSERCSSNFKRLSPQLASYVYFPKVYWDSSTSKVLTMEFIDGVGITDVTSIKKLGIHPTDVAKLVSQTFAEMIFKHGFVHCDPHAANMMVQIAPSTERNRLRKRKPQLVLLDHGLYKVLDQHLREYYAKLWKALVFADEKGIKENSVKLGAGEDLYVLFASVLTMKPWKKVVDPSIDHLRIGVTDEDRAARQIYASQLVKEISELLRRLPRVLLLLLKTNDCLRAVDHALGASVNTYVIVGRVSSIAAAELELSKASSKLSTVYIYLEKVEVEARLLLLQLFAWFMHLQNYTKSLTCTVKGALRIW